MATEALEVHMARLEGAYEQINERLASIEHRLASEFASLRGEFAGQFVSQRTELKSEIEAVRLELKSELRDHRRQTTAQFYWTLTFILGAILTPILLDVILTR